MKQSETKIREEQPDIRFMLISDVHVRTPEVSDETSRILEAGLKDMKALDPNSTALVTVGDNTGNGEKEQVAEFYRILDQYNPVDDDRTLIALGNHDVRGPGPVTNWSKDPSADIPFWNETAKPLYMEKNARYMPKGQDKDTVYYDKWLDGYHFIILNTENGVKDACTLSEKQLNWFECRLAEAEDDRPVFVFIHQPLNDTHWRSNILNGFGLEDEKVKNILKKYPQVILMCGHIHNGHGVTEAVVREYGTTVEVPSYNESENGYMEPGSGYYVEVYRDRVVYRARNFSTSSWLPEYDIVVKLPVLGAVYQRACKLDEKDYTEESWNEVRELMSQAEKIFHLKYMQDDLTWDTVAPAPTQLFGKETGDKADLIASELNAAVKRLKRQSHMQ